MALILSIEINQRFFSTNRFTKSYDFAVLYPMIEIMGFTTEAIIKMANLLALRPNSNPVFVVIWRGETRILRVSFVDINIFIFVQKKISP